MFLLLSLLPGVLLFPLDDYLQPRCDLCADLNSESLCLLGQDCALGLLGFLLVLFRHGLLSCLFMLLFLFFFFFALALLLFEKLQLCLFLFYILSVSS